MINMWNQDLSLGIDLSDRHVSAVLLSRRRDKISAVKTVHQPLPLSAFSGDEAKTAQAVGKAIRQMLFRAGIRQKKAAVSFGLENLLLQMIDIPEQLPGNVGQYIRRQIRNSTQLNSKNPCLDFTAMTKSDPQEVQRCLVAAMDQQKVETLTKSMSLAKLNPQAIDIPILALCRALYKKQISQGFKQHILLFYLHGRDVYLAVLRNTNLDYIRHLERLSADSQAGFEPWSIEQIRAVMQYYETESIAKGEEGLSWRIILASENRSDDMDRLKTGIETSLGGEVLYVNHENAEAWLPVEKNKSINGLPLAATGAALRKWTGSGLKTEIDLLPEQNRKMRFVADYLINTSKIAVAVILLILCCTCVLSARVSRIQNSFSQNSRIAPQGSIEQLVTEKKNLFGQLDVMQKQKKQVESMIGGYSVGAVAGLLDQIRQHTPAGVRMTQLWSSSKGLIEIQGYCRTMEDIQSYARRLETADYIKAAQVRQSEIHSKNPNLRCFTIICTLREGI